MTTGAFHDVRFPAAISFGSTGGPERRTEIVTLSSGHEVRNTPWAHARRRYNAGLGLRRLDDVHEVLSFFEARRGRLFGFRWKDWTDWKSCPPSAAISAADQRLGTGDGTASVFQLARSYGLGAAEYIRPVTRPVAGSVRIAADGVELAEGAGFAIDTATGLVTFTTPPASGAVLTCGFAFDVPVRFDTDTLDINLAAFEAGEIPAIPVVELRA